jgi:hypothetical protein
MLTDAKMSSCIAGTLANLYGLSLTSADHGAFLIQLVCAR